MRHIIRSVEIDAPPAVVWDLITVFAHWARWGPTVRRVEADAPRVAVGVTGKVQTPVGLRLPFVITEVVAGHAWGWRVAGIPATGHRLHRIGPSSCRLEFSVPWMAAPYVPVVRSGLRRVKRLAESMAR